VRLHRIVPFLLLALTALVFHPVRGHEFVDYDDHVYVVENPNLTEGLGLQSIAHAFAKPYFGNWIPLTSISLQIDYARHGLEPAGYLLTNVALHALSALLLYFALARMTRAPWPSAFIAAIFAIHPLHVESVAWVSSRKDVLCGLFWMLTLCAYAYYAEKPRSGGRYALVATGVALALLSKPLAVTLPFALLMLDYWPLGRLGSEDGRRLIEPRRLRRLLLEKLPLLALAGAAAAVTYAIQEDTGVVRSAQFSLSLRASNALLSYALYLGDAIWPSGLAAFYPYPHRGVQTRALLLALLALCGISALAVCSARRRPHVLSGWLWYLGTLVPMIGIVQVGLQARADRYTYIPLIGIAIMLAWSAKELAARWRPARIPLAVAGTGAVAALATAASVQVGVWHDTISLFERAIAVTEGNYLAHHRLAATYRARGNFAKADSHFRETFRINPHWPAPQLEYASMLRERGDFAGAALYFERGLRLDPQHARARKLLGLCLLELGRYAESQAELTRALGGGEDLAEIHASLGFAAFAQGDAEAGVQHSREALRLEPFRVFAANNLAWALATHPSQALRDPQEAVRVAEAALAHSGNESPDLLDTLAAAYASAGRFEEAVQAETDALRMAIARGEASKAADYQVRLALYRGERPFVEGAAPPTTEPTAERPSGP
jgi:tetratricopeptide (TPR) repeat protein